MNDNRVLKEEQIAQADAAFFVLMQQIDHLFGVVSFYLERYPCDGSRGDYLKTSDIQQTVGLLGNLPMELAEVIKRWKEDQPRILSKLGVEIFILNEIWAHIEALIYFLTSHQIELDPFDAVKGMAALKTLITLNNLIS